MRDRIDILVNDLRPDGCLDVGLDCRTCTHATASDLASICEVLDRQGLREAFVQIYQNPACNPMFSIFERAYGEAVSPRTTRPLAATAAA
jgi:hypothetical protein